jgi:hypothetical protein
MGAAEEGERLVVEALQAELMRLTPAAARSAKRAASTAVGVGLERDLDVVGARPPMRARGLDHRFDRRRLHQRRRAAAEEDRGQRRPGSSARFMARSASSASRHASWSTATRGHGC